MDELSQQLLEPAGNPLPLIALRGVRSASSHVPSMAGPPVPARWEPNTFPCTECGLRSGFIIDKCWAAWLEGKFRDQICCAGVQPPAMAVVSLPAAL